MMNSFNDSLKHMWPCAMSLYIGYIFCPVTCGLSFLLPNLCIKDAEFSLRRNIDYYNKYKLEELDMELKLVKSCCTSWIELRVKKTEHNTSQEEELELMAKSPRK